MIQLYIFILSFFLIDGQEAFSGIIRYNVSTPDGKKTAEVYYMNTWLFVVEERKDDWASQFKTKYVRCELEKGYCWDRLEKNETWYPLWGGPPLKIDSIFLDTVENSIAFLGFKCWKYKVIYEPHLSEFGTTLIFDEFWVTPLKVVQHAPVKQKMHLLACNPSTYLPLKAKRTTETISIFEQTFSSSISYCASEISSDFSMD